MGGRRSRAPADPGAAFGLAGRTDGAEERTYSVHRNDRAAGGGAAPASASPEPTRGVHQRRHTTHAAGSLVVRYAAKRAKVPTGVHILRHTFCSPLVMRGAAMQSVQELVGHQDLTMTQRYSHLSPGALGDTIRLLEHRGLPNQDGD